MSIATLPPLDVEQIGDNLYEVIDGEKIGLPPMAIFSVWIASEIHGFLRDYARRFPTGRSLSEALFHLPDPVNRDRRPDVAFVSYENWPKDRSVPRFGDAWGVVPDLAVEVVSPNDNAAELERKIGEYFRAGVRQVWKVFPIENIIHVYDGPMAIRPLGKSDVLDGGAVLPGFMLPLADLFSEPADGMADANGARS